MEKPKLTEKMRPKFRLESSAGQGTRQPMTQEEFLSGAPAQYSAPEGMMKLNINISASHHVALQVEAQNRRISIAELVEKMAEQLPEYQRIYGLKS